MKIYLILIALVLFTLGIIINQRHQLMHNLKVHSLTIERIEKPLNTVYYSAKHHQTWWGKANPKLFA